jgi:serine/threonine protein kinase
MQSMTLPIGTELGGYVLAGVLGSGASGTVYRARDADGLPVALKLLHPTSAGDTASRRRLRREVRAQRAIRSPFVAQVVDAELEGAEAFIVTELVEGVSLARDITDNGPWDPDQLAELARELDQALEAVHSAGVLHRDIKPSNVVLNKQGMPVLIDFGIAQDHGAGRITAAGLVAGTPGFVSPGLLRGGEPSADSDRWAAAALLLNAATGRQPYGSGTVEAVLAKVIDGLPDVDGLPDHIASAFLRALTPDDAKRIGLIELAQAIDPATAAVDQSTEQLLPPTVLSPPSDDPLTAWTKPMQPPWSEPRRVDYRRWLRDTRDAAADAARPPAGGPGPDFPPTEGPFPPGLQRLPGDPLVAADAVRPPLPYPSPPAPLRLLTLGLLALFSASGGRWPVAVMVVSGCALVLARTVWVAVEAVAARRYRRGPRPSDRTRTALAVPWYFLRGLGGSIPALALAGLVGWASYMVATHVLNVAEAELAVATAVCLATALVVAWWGPSGQETRCGARTILRGLLGAPWARWLVTLLIWALAGLIATLMF